MQTFRIGRELVAVSGIEWKAKQKGRDMESREEIRVFSGDESLEEIKAYAESRRLKAPADVYPARRPPICNEVAERYPDAYYVRVRHWSPESMYPCAAPRHASMYALIDASILPERGRLVVRLAADGSAWFMDRMRDGLDPDRCATVVWFDFAPLGIEPFERRDPDAFWRGTLFDMGGDAA